MAKLADTAESSINGLFADSALRFDNLCPKGPRVAIFLDQDCELILTVGPSQEAVIKTNFRDSFGLHRRW